MEKQREREEKRRTGGDKESEAGIDFLEKYGE